MADEPLPIPTAARAAAYREVARDLRNQADQLASPDLAIRLREVAARYARLAQVVNDLPPPEPVAEPLDGSASSES